MRKRWMTWILLGVLVAYFCLQFFATYLIISTAPAGMPSDLTEQLKAMLQFPDAFTMIFAVAQGIGIILLVILVASVVGNEYGQGTVRQMLTKNGDRMQYLGAKVIAFFIVALIGLVLSLIVGFLLSCLTTYWLAGGINWDFLSASFVGTVAGMFGRTFSVLVVYILFITFLTVIGRSVLVGIGGGLGYYFVEGVAISLLGQASGWPSRIPDYLMGGNINAIMSLNQLDKLGISTGVSFGPTTQLPSAFHATVVLIIYCLAFLILSFYLLGRQDLTA
jgi:ABC-type transport system involved in multi-copper enzyme maturation permease subunit